jgi:hypothetical protein
MAQTFTTAAMGTAANDGSGNKLRVGGLKIAVDLTELFARVTALEAGGIMVTSILRHDSSVACNGSSGQVITYSTPFSNVKPIIDDYEGRGIEITAYNANGFTITSIEAGNFGYVTLAEL